MSHGVVSDDGNIVSFILVESGGLYLVSDEVDHFVADFDAKGVFVWEVLAELEEKAAVPAANIHEVHIELLGFAALERALFGVEIQRVLFGVQVELVWRGIGFGLFVIYHNNNNMALSKSLILSKSSLKIDFACDLLVSV